MKKTDKILIGIVAGIILLVVVAFGVALSKPQPTYMAEDTPEGVAFNYLFALQQKDYERAYGYLQPALPGHPKNVADFEDDIRDFSWTFNRMYNDSITLSVESADISGERADVRIQETRFYEGDLFNSNQYISSFRMTLRQDANGQWRVVDSDRYWLSCWTASKGCN